MPESKRPRFFYGYIVVLAAFLLMAVVLGNFFTYGIFFKPILTEFGWSKAVTSGAYSLCVGLYGSVSIVAGRLSDRLSPRVVTLAGGIFLGLGYLLMSQVRDVWQLYLFYGLIGIGTGGFWAPLLSLTVRWFVKRRGLVSGIVGSGVGLGTMIIAPVVSWLISSYGWRNAYIIAGIVALVWITVVAQFLKPSPRQMGLVAYGEGEVSRESPDQALSGLPFRDVVRQKGFRMLVGLYICFGFFHLTIMVHIVPHAIELGISATKAAYILAVLGWASLFSRIAMGSIADHIGNKRGLVISLATMSVVLLSLSAVTEVWMFYLFAAAFGFAYAGLSVIQPLIAAELFGLRSIGVIVGILVASWTFGGVIGPVVSGGIFDITGNYQLAFIICVAFSAVGLVLTLLLPSADSTADLTYPKGSGG